MTLAKWWPTPEGYWEVIAFWAEELFPGVQTTKTKNASLVPVGKIEEAGFPDVLEQKVQ
jgi:hypothetical protein